MAEITIRKDFESISEYLNVFLEYYKTFKEFNVVDWAHLKHREDFDQVYSLDANIRGLYQQLYIDGRNIAIYFQSQLQEFNYPDQYINITSYVKSFENSWIDKIGECEDFIKKVKEQVSKEENPLWSIEQMVVIYEKQIDLLKEIKKVIDRIRYSKLYRLDNPTRLDKVQLKLKEHPMKTSVITASLVLGITMAFSINAEVSPITNVNNIQGSNQGQIINGNNNSVVISTSSSVHQNERVHVMNQSTKLFEEGGLMVTKQIPVCDIEKGARVQIIEQKQDPSSIYATYVKVKVLDGICQNKTGWTGTNNLTLQ
ncbi:MAG: hypothetical protein PHN18_10365 [Sulfurospirillaceae bacterium]|nr:hypothetical protein [Sulfurospirillaceae bacterium]MDD2827457.1 hypothetical protein [Sulfurospirillaceae bacterium]